MVNRIFHYTLRSSVFHITKGAKRVAVVTHVAIIRVMLLYVEGRDLNDYKKVPVVNGGIFEIGDELLSY